MDIQIEKADVGNVDWMSEHRYTGYYSIKVVTHIDTDDGIVVDSYFPDGKICHKNGEKLWGGFKALVSYQIDGIVMLKAKAVVYVRRELQVSTKEATDYVDSLPWLTLPDS